MVIEKNKKETIFFFLHYKNFIVVVSYWFPHSTFYGVEKGKKERMGKTEEVGES
jgi:hypothetical protein